MADNITAPGAGSVLATDEISSVHHPLTKIEFGADGTATPVSSANPLPVSIGAGPFAVTGSFFQATQPVSAASLPLPTGAATDAGLTTISGKLPTLGPKASSGSVSVAPASDATFAVSGTFWQATQPVSLAALPALATGGNVIGSVTQSGAWNVTNITGTVSLPTGAATAAKQDLQTAAVDNLASAKRWFAITPADTALATVPDGLFVGGAGTVVARGDDGTDATFTVAAGAFLPIRPAQVRAASTATGIVGLVN